MERMKTPGRPVQSVLQKPDVIYPLPSVKIVGWTYALDIGTEKLFVDEMNEGSAQKMLRPSEYRAMQSSEVTPQ